MSATPPRFLRLAGHPLRWQLLTELAQSDRRVGELCALSGRRQPLVSYHLRQLRDGGLLSTRRSSADGRDTYYALDLARCGELLSHAGAALHPGLASAPAAPAREARVLFLCTGNSARSPMAAALCEQRSGGAVRADSAGSHPKPLNPAAVRALHAYGLDLAGHRPRSLHELVDEPFDAVVTLCDRVREVCPEFPGGSRAVHWSLPEPASVADFERVAAELCTRLDFLIAATTSREVSAHA